MKASEAKALLAAMAEAAARGEDVSKMAIAAMVKAGKPFVAEAKTWTSNQGAEIDSVAISGEGFLPKYLSPRLLRAVLANAPAVTAAIEAAEASEAARKK